jgi:translation initiation factor eIF-2B subunit delta
MLDSITWNELGNPDELAKTSNDSKPNILQNWRETPNLTLLSVFYDVTPREFITMIVCEFGMIPPTSVPVILREYGNPDADSDTLKNTKKIN